jgi:hypothetical protein
MSGQVPSQAGEVYEEIAPQCRLVVIFTLPFSTQRVSSSFHASVFGPRSERVELRPSDAVWRGSPMEVIMVDPKDKQPAEGSREVIDKELGRQGGGAKPKDDKEVEQKGPAQPRS